MVVRSNWLGTAGSRLKRNSLPLLTQKDGLRSRFGKHSQYVRSFNSRFQQFIRNVRVDLRCGNAGVSEQALHKSNIDARFN